MASCACCGKTFLMGGKKESGLRFCSQNCLDRGPVLALTKQVREEDALALAWQIKRNPCPECDRDAPVEEHRAHEIRSFILMSSWKSQSLICCRKCGLKAQGMGLLGSTLLGWWGIPWGILITPVQIVRNIIGMLRPPRADRVSARLLKTARLMVAQDMAAGHMRRLQETPPPLTPEALYHQNHS